MTTLGSSVLAAAVAAALVLMVAGVAKLRAPVATAATVRTLGVPAPPAVRMVLARALGAGEVLLGLGVVAVGGRVLLSLLAVTFAGLAGVAAVLLRRSGDASCGCFGSTDAPVGLTHVIVDGLAAVVAGAAAVTAPAAPLDIVRAAPVPVAMVLIVQVLLLAELAVLAVSVLPSLTRDRRRLEVVA